jgi:trimethylamine---corrinoid protein Co-methyltransferase
LLAAQGGANLIYGAGMLELGVTFDFAQLMMDNEIFKMIKKVIGGIEITDEKMALEVIHDVGPGGQFVSHQHTYERFRTEQSQSRLIDRQNRTGWLASGGKSMTERAYEEAIAILESYKPYPLPSAAVDKLREIVEEAEKEYGLR